MGIVVDYWNSIKELSEDNTSGLKRRIKSNKVKSTIIYDKINGEVSYLIEVDIDRNIQLPKCKEISYIVTDCKLSIISKEEYGDVFFYFIDDLYYYICNERDSLIIADKICYVINRWKYFFSSKVLDNFSKEKEVGLWGELETLRRLIIHNSEKLLYMWNGPLKYIHDFSLKSIDIETKTILVSENCRYNIHINSGEQLYSNKRLLLNVNLLEEDVKGCTLSELINDISNLLTESDIKYFFELLHNVGYIPACGKKIRYCIKESNYYEINDDFPRYPIKEGIISLNYIIDIDKIESNRINFDYKI